MIEYNQDNRKLLYHPDAIRNWLSSGVCHPVTIEIDPSLVCNHRCPECTFHQYIGNQFIPQTVLAKIVSELSTVEAKGVIISGGGEPLTNPETWDFIENLAKADIDVTLTTNGSLTNRDSLSLLKYCRRIRISVDAASPEVFLKTHGMPQAHFERVLNNLRELISIKKEKGLDTDIGISFLISQESEKDVIPAMKLYREIGVDFIQFKPMQFYNKIQDKWYYIHSESIDAYTAESAEFIDNSYRISFLRGKYFSGEMDNRRYSECHGAVFDLVIGADAKVYICCHLKYNSNYCIGDMQIESLEDIIKQIPFQSSVTKDCIPFCRLDSINELLEDFSNDHAVSEHTIANFNDDDAFDRNWL